MTTDQKWKKSPGFWTGVEESLVNPGTCILRTHPPRRLISTTMFLIVLWSTWLMVFTNDHSHSFEKDTFFGTLTGTIPFLSSPIFVWGYGVLLVLVSITSLPQTLIIESDAPLFTHFIGFERFGIRFVRPRRSIRGLLLVLTTWKGRPTTHTYVAWTGIGLPAMIAGCNDYQVAQTHADCVSSKTGIPRLSVDQQKEEARRRLWSAGCFSILFGTKILRAWISKGNQPFDIDLAHAQGSASAAIFALLMSFLFFPLTVLDFLVTALKLIKMREKRYRLEIGRAEDGTGTGSRQ